MNLYEAITVLADGLGKPLEWLADADRVRELAVECMCCEPSRAELLPALYVFREWKRRQR